MATLANTGFPALRKKIIVNMCTITRNACIKNSIQPTKIQLILFKNTFIK